MPPAVIPAADRLVSAVPPAVSASLSEPLTTMVVTSASVTVSVVTPVLEAAPRDEMLSVSTPAKLIEPTFKSAAVVEVPAITVTESVVLMVALVIVPVRVLPVRLAKSKEAPEARPVMVPVLVFAPRTTSLMPVAVARFTAVVKAVEKPTFSMPETLRKKLVDASEVAATKPPAPTFKVSVTPAPPAMVVSPDKRLMEIVSLAVPPVMLTN